MLCRDGFNDATLQMLPRVLRPGIAEVHEEGAVRAAAAAGY